MTEVPWHVAIYQDDEQICGGTIVSERLVISAAHCFSGTKSPHLIDYKKFKVAAGKTQRALDEVDSPVAQIRDVESVQIPNK